MAKNADIIRLVQFKAISTTW